MTNRPDDYERFARYHLPGDLVTLSERQQYFQNIFLKSVEDHAPVVLERLAGDPLTTFRNHMNWNEDAETPAEKAYSQLWQDWYAKKIEIPDPLKIMSEEELAPIKAKAKRKSDAYENALNAWADAFGLGDRSFENGAEWIKSHARDVLNHWYYSWPLASWVEPPVKWVEPSMHFVKMLPDEEMTFRLPAWERLFNPRLIELKNIKEEIDEIKKDLDRQLREAKRLADRVKEKRGTEKKPAPRNLKRDMEYLVKFHVLKLEINDFAPLNEEEASTRRAIERLAPLLELILDRPRTLSRTKEK